MRFGELEVSVVPPEGNRYLRWAKPGQVLICDGADLLLDLDEAIELRDDLIRAIEWGQTQ
ncbi:hypothetical protein [Nocardia aurea]|uniref:hypothetical protein n=1 Tax=Nocardia aurea TaxID=2144174 RepID=UPI0013009DB9|nr:hypothetical protein [Nocardia aurea]